MSAPATPDRPTPRPAARSNAFTKPSRSGSPKQPPTTTIDDLQTQLDLFRLIYNHHRPHRSIGRRFPADVWATAAKSGPADQPIGTPTQTYNATISGGRINLSRNLRITVGATYNGLPATIVITADTAHVFIAGHHIRRLTIDPTNATNPSTTDPDHHQHLPSTPPRGKPRDMREGSPATRQ